MTFPVSDVFDVVDYNSLKGQTGSSFSSQDDHLTNYASFPHGNVVVDTGYTMLSADASVTPDLVRKATVLLTDSLPRGIPGTFTVEFTVHFPTTTTDGVEDVHLPLDFSSPDSRVGVGAFSKNGCAGYVLFSHKGIALANSMMDPSPRILGGSHDIIFDQETGLPYKEGVNFRIIVNSEDKRIYVYSGRLSSVYELGADGNYSQYTDADVRYTPSAPISKEAYGDVVAASASARGANLLDGEEGEDFAFYLSSLRVSSVARPPVNRPVAIATAPAQAIVGSPIQPSGVSSYDSLSRELVYDWDILVRPDGDKTSRLQGKKHATATVGSADDDNRLRFTFLDPSSKYNGFKLSVVVGSPSSPLTIENLSHLRTIRITLAADSFGNSITTANDILEAFNSPRAGGHNARISGGIDLLSNETFDAVLRVEFGASHSNGLGAVSAEESVFSGGTGSNLVRPIFLPTKPGIYVFGLKVSNGVRTSHINRAVVSVQLSEQLLGHRPDTSYIFKYLPDFWNLVPEKSQIEPVWSAAAQAIAADLSALWQTDMNKTLRDISRRYRRRWQSYPCAFEFDESVGVDIVHPPSLVWGESVDICQMQAGAMSGLPVRSVGKHFDSNFALFLDHEISVPTPINRRVNTDILDDFVSDFPSQVGNRPHYLVRVPGEHIKVASFSKTADYNVNAYFPAMASEIFGGVTFSYTSEPIFSRYREISKSSAGRFVRDPLAARVSPERSVILSDGSYPMSRLQAGQDYVIVVLGDEGSRNATTVKARVLGLNPSGVENSVELDIDPQLVDGRPIEWYHAEPIDRFTVERVPYLSFDSNVDPTILSGASLGDVFVGKFADPVTSQEVTVGLPIIAAVGNAIFIDWLPLLAALRVLLIQSGSDSENPDLWTRYSDLIRLGITPISVKRSRVLADTEDLVAVPRLQETTTTQPQGPYYEGTDYSISDSGGIQINDWIRARGRIDWSSPNTILIGKNNTHFLVKHISLDPESSGGWSENSDKLMSELGLSTVVIEIGAPGVYTISGFSDAIPGDINSGVRIHVGRSLFPSGEHQYSGPHNADGQVDVVLHVPRYSFLSEPPARLWAEVSYFDNMKTVENNFGLFVGLPKSVVEAADENLDYLSVVRSAWFALMSGPSIDNLKLAAQSFLDLPYAEKPGRITYLSEPGYVRVKNSDGTVSRVVDPKEDGSIIIRNSDGTTSTYKYRPGMEIAKNPRTGRPFASFSSSQTRVEGDEDYETYLDARVQAYEPLVDVVSIIDYVDNPETIQRQFSGVDQTFTTEDGRVLPIDEPTTLVEQYHTFILEVPLNLIRTTQAFDLIREFMMESKPAYTRFIILGTLKFSDEIDAVDSIEMSPTVYLRDTPASSPVSKPLYWSGHDLRVLDGDATNPANHTLGGKIFKIISPSDPDSAYHNRAAYVWPEEATESRDWAIDGHRIYNPDREIANTISKLLSDVAEKYESGYCEGVLDDFSGDGSHNALRSELDMVNTADGDIDTMRSKVWVPIQRWTDEQEEGQGGVEFNVGDYVNIFTPAEFNNFGPVDATKTDKWGIIEYIGSGEHPRLPGVFNPQAEHPYTYLLIGFDSTQPVHTLPGHVAAGSNESGTIDNFYTWDHRHRYIKRYGPAGSPKASILPINDDGDVDLSFNDNFGPDRQNPNHAKYFLLEYIWQTDKLLEYGPKSDPTITLTTYVGLNGMSNENLVEDALRVHIANNFDHPLENFDKEGYVPPAGTENFRYSVQAPVTPYNPVDNQGRTVHRNCVSRPHLTDMANPFRWGYKNTAPPGPGLFFNWSNLRTADGDPTRDGPDAFNYLQNVHIGFTVAARKGHHYHAGFVDFKIPTPAIKLIQHNEDGTLRICGFYFCADDPTRQNVPGVDHFGDGHPADYDGLIGGSWVHFRNVETGEDVPVMFAPVFETDNPEVNGQRKVTGISHYRADGSIAYLRSVEVAGKVLEITPPILSDGLYDIIVRNYRPYQMRENGSWQYHVDAAVAARAWSVDDGSPVLDWGMGPFGQAPFGGG